MDDRFHDNAPLPVQAKQPSFSQKQRVITAACQIDAQSVAAD